MALDNLPDDFPADLRESFVFYAGPLELAQTYGATFIPARDGEPAHARFRRGEQERLADAPIRSE